MLYLVQVVIYTAIMCIVYALVLRNKPMHSFNRFYLLSAVILPLVLPFMQLPVTISEHLKENTALRINLQEFVFNATGQKAAWSAGNTFWIVYAAGVAILLSVTIYRIAAIWSVIKKHPGYRCEGYTLIPNSGFGPGSWHTYVFLPGEEGHPTVINHELAHIRLHHTKDILLLNLVQAFFWPNLLLVWIRKELVQVHEFQADAATGMEAGAYAELLLSNLFGRCTLPATHSFIVHPIKRRIMMLKQNSNKKQRYASGIIAVMAVSALLITGLGIQSCNTKKWDIKQKQGSSTAVLKYAEKMPEFPGDINAFISQHIVFPASARAKNIEGKVYIKFVVDKDGSVINKEIITSSDASLSQSALAMMAQMPKWIPGEDHGQKVAVEFVLPIQFKLQ